MRWRYGYSWTLFLGASALIAVVSEKAWPQRIILFVAMAVPITIWALRRARRQS